jgi:uncharacterized protein (DUF362 family)
MARREGETMDRRKFLKISTITGIALAVPNGVSLLLSKPAAAEIPDLAVVHGSSAAGITKAAIDMLGGIKKFISKGDVVVVKPNIGWDRTPEFAANTNPEVVAAVVKLCFDAGARKVKVFDRPCVDPRRSYKQSGIADAVKSLGAELSFMDERKYKEVPLGGLALKSWPLYQEVLEADKIINLPIAKHHSLAKLTMGMKNWMGVMGGSRGKLHQNLDEGLVDVSMKLRPCLIVLDAVRILTANGPQGGELRDVKRLDTVIAGIDQVAVDSFGATLFGLKGNQLGYIAAGHKAGLGNMDLGKAKIRKINL